MLYEQSCYSGTYLDSVNVLQLGTRRYGIVRI